MNLTFLAAAEKIKFSTQLGVDWVIAEFDKLSRLVEQNATTVTEAMENFVGGDFEFDESSMETPADAGEVRLAHDAPSSRAACAARLAKLARRSRYSLRNGSIRAA